MIQKFIRTNISTTISLWLPPKTEKMEESNGNFDFCFQKENKWKLHGETIGKVIAYLTTENYRKTTSLDTWKWNYLSKLFFISAKQKALNIRYLSKHNQTKASISPILQNKEITHFQLQMQGFSSNLQHGS